MAIENTYLLGKNITLGCGFDLQAKAPLDSRQTVPAFAGLQALIDGNAAYEGMIVYDEETKKTYQAQIVDDVLKFREFGINESELKDLIASETTAAMEFKGAANALPENPAKGDMYKVTASFKVGEEDAKIGDSIVYDGKQWFIIPSGDDIEDTWRPITGVDNDATLTFAAGDKLEKTVAADGTITYKHVAIDAPTNMNEEGDEQTRTYITQLITDNHGHIIGFKTATENVEDTNTTYEFEGQSDEATSVYFQVKSSDAEAAEVVYLDAYSKNEADAAFKAKRAEALAATETEANVFVDTVAQDVDGNITITTKAVDFSAITDRLDDLEAIDHTHSFADEEALNGITAEKVADWDDAVSKEHTHTFVDTDVEDAIAKKHSHTFVEAELNKIADGDVAKWNAAEQNAKDYTDDEIEKLALGTMSKETADDYVKKSDATGYADILTKTEAQGAYQAKGDYATAEQGGKADSALQSVRVLGKELTKDANEITVNEAKTALGLGTASEKDADFYLEKQNAEWVEGDLRIGDDASHTKLSTNSLTIFDGGNEAFTRYANGSISVGNSTNNTSININLPTTGGTLALASEVATAESNAKQYADERIGTLASSDEYSNVVEYIDYQDAQVLATVNEIAGAAGEQIAGLAAAIEDAKTDASNKDAVVLSEAQKYADGKVNALAGNVYTKTEVEDLLCWGEF